MPNRSPNNPGAKQMMEELEAAAGGRRARRLPRRLSPQAPLTMDLKWTTDARQMEAAEHFLLYLNDRTWEPGQLKRQLTRELITALSLGWRKIHLLLVHEEATCPFSSFFAPNATPAELRKRDICAPPPATRATQLRTLRARATPTSSRPRPCAAPIPTRRHLPRPTHHASACARLMLRHAWRIIWQTRRLQSG